MLFRTPSANKKKFDSGKWKSLKFQFVTLKVKFLCTKNLQNLWAFSPLSGLSALKCSPSFPSHGELLAYHEIHNIMAYPALSSTNVMDNRVRCEANIKFFQQEPALYRLVLLIYIIYVCVYICIYILNNIVLCGLISRASLF